jgi:thymidylate synthase
LNVELGNYYHSVGSMHLYERHFSLAKDIINEGLSKKIKSMPNMINLGQHKTFLNIESRIRNNEIEIDELLSLEIDRYWKDLLLILMNFRYKKNKIENSLLKIAYEEAYKNLLV